MNVFAQSQQTSSLKDLASLIQTKESNNASMVQKFIKKYDLQCSELTVDFKTCHQYIGEEPFPYLMVFQNKENKIVAYVSEKNLPIIKGNEAPTCKDAGNYPKICFLPTATNKEKTKLYKDYLNSMRAAG